jgi:hypothetical protein
MATETPEVLRDGATRAEIAEAFANLVAHARRQQSIVEKYTTDVPTAWTKAHQHIDALLWDWQAAE